jgi:asparagine synthase (glutamine-hydrolysing)
MCGIVGVLAFGEGAKLPNSVTFDRMTDALAHRGPDGRGVWRGRRVLLGHRRLAVLDPTPAGRQPMVHRSRGLVISFNGEIYNFRELRQSLESLGANFETRTDTEVLLAGFAQWGAALVERIRGMFAIAIWDERAETLWLARDHLGVKPLFFAATEDRFWFASEMKAILADREFHRAVDPVAVDDFLSLCYVPGPRTAFLGIRQLPPGCTLTVGRDRSSEVVKRYWKPLIAEEVSDRGAALLEFSERLDRTVAAQMVSDVPLGAFLSGGLDSAALVASMVKRAPGSIRTFFVGFEEASFDEAIPAGRTANLLGTEHHTSRLSLDVADHVLALASANDDLFADSSTLAMDLLCREARRSVTVALSGDGADEILAGYSTYFATYLARIWRRLPTGVRAFLGKVIAGLPASRKRYNWPEFAGRFLRGAEKGSGRDHASWRLYLDSPAKASLLRADWPGVGVDDGLQRYAAALSEPGEGVSLLKRMMYADLTFYLPADMLVKVDRASMRHGLEVRVPFLDHELVEFCLGLDTRLLRSTLGTTKPFLRAHLRSSLSSEVARRPKRGFNVPLSSAFRGKLHDLFMDSIRAQSFRERGPLKVDAVEALARRHREGRAEAAAVLYLLLVLALWWQRWSL